MSSDPFDELPDQFKKALREMMEKLQSIDPEELEAMMKQMFGKEFMDKMNDLSHGGGSFVFPLDPNMAKNFESMMKNIMEGKPTNFQDMNEEEEPYYEITPIVDGEGEIVVEMPGIMDVRQVQWDRTGEILTIEAETDEITYKVQIPLEETIKLKDIFASVKNSVFILPYTE